MYRLIKHIPFKSEELKKFEIEFRKSVKQPHRTAQFIAVHLLLIGLTKSIDGSMESALKETGYEFIVSNKDKVPLLTIKSNQFPNTIYNM